MEKLVKKAKKGDPEAFTELMQMHMQAMYKTARAILANDEDCADAISETILVCWEKLYQLKEPAYFKTWMIRILINKSRDILRARSRVTYMEEVPEARAFAAESTLEFREALEALDEKYRLPIVLYYVDGWKTREIGQALELPESTVRTRLARGRCMLANYYDPQGNRRKSV